jgi:hypothetical protein
MPPVATELARLGNVLGSTKLIALADKVARLERDAMALDAYLRATGRQIAERDKDTSTPECPTCWEVDDGPCPDCHRTIERNEA